MPCSFGIDADRRENVGVKLQADHVLAFVQCAKHPTWGQADLVMELTPRRGAAVMLRFYPRIQSRAAIDRGGERYSFDSFSDGRRLG